jgi:Flp pilus assembly protein TadG
MKSSHESNSKLARACRRCAHMLRFVPGEDRGSALIELTLVMPVFALLTVGWVDFARTAYFSIEASNAARAGVAYAAQGTTFATNTSGIQAAADNDAPNLTSVATLAVTSNSVCQCDNAGTFTTIGTTTSACASASSSCLSPSRVISYVQVNTSAQVSSIFANRGAPAAYTVRGQAIMRIK